MAVTLVFGHVLRHTGHVHGACMSGSSTHILPSDHGDDLLGIGSAYFHLKHEVGALHRRCPIRPHLKIAWVLERISGPESSVLLGSIPKLKLAVGLPRLC